MNSPISTQPHLEDYVSVDIAMMNAVDQDGVVPDRTEFARRCAIAEEAFREVDVKVCHNGQNGLSPGQDQAIPAAAKQHALPKVHVVFQASYFANCFKSTYGTRLAGGSEPVQQAPLATESMKQHCVNFFLD